MFSVERRRAAFLVLTAFVIAYVRNTIQYGKYGIQPYADFLILWFIHYVALLITAGLYWVLLNSVRRKLLPGRGNVEAEDAILQFFVAILIGSIAIFVLYHWPEYGGLE